MTTYTTIKEAFANGTGDQFYKKDNQFVCISRHLDAYEKMLAVSFTFVPYSQVRKAVMEDNGYKFKPETSYSNEARELIVNKPAKTFCSRSTCDQYYEEFPDAYGQNL
jgi:hypothetical protein